MYEKSEIYALKQQALYYKLKASGKFWFASAENLIPICNGCGPERWSDLTRKIATDVLKRYEATFAIHDFDYTEKKISQKEADNRLKENMLKIWRKDFGWKRWLTHNGRFNRIIVIPAVYAAVAIGGESAYKKG